MPDRARFAGLITVPFKGRMLALGRASRRSLTVPVTRRMIAGMVQSVLRG
jgi:hypothetical protein